MKTWCGHMTSFVFCLLLASCGGNNNPPTDSADFTTSQEETSSQGQKNIADYCTLTEKNGIITVTLRDDKNQHTLAFVKIDSDNAKIDIALRKADAQRFYREAQLMWQEKNSSSSSPLLPWILMAVSESPVEKTIRPFWFQQEPMSSSEELYKTIVKEGSSESMSYNDARLVIEKLNHWCKGKVTFDLPSEEQFVYLARQLYNPVQTTQLISCQDFSDGNSDIFTQVKQFSVNKLLGDKWQLTKSDCLPFDSDSKDITCDKGTYVKKGGTRDSTDATECMPEARADSAPDVREPNTTFRLVLTNNQ
jgi:hypothetical protein